MVVSFYWNWPAVAGRQAGKARPTEKSAWQGAKDIKQDQKGCRSIFLPNCVQYAVSMHQSQYLLARPYKKMQLDGTLPNQLSIWHFSKCPIFLKIKKYKST